MDVLQSVDDGRLIGSVLSGTFEYFSPVLYYVLVGEPPVKKLLVCSLNIAYFMEGSW